MAKATIEELGGAYETISEAVARGEMEEPEARALRQALHGIDIEGTTESILADLQRDIQKDTPVPFRDDMDNDIYRCKLGRKRNRNKAYRVVRIAYEEGRVRPQRYVQHIDILVGHGLELSEEEQKRIDILREIINQK